MPLRPPYPPRRGQPELLSDYAPGHRVAEPDFWRGAALFASPHAGRIYPTSLLGRSKLSLHELRRNEDIYIDELFSSVADAGAPMLTALFPRVVVDVNRAETELLPDWLDALGEPHVTPTPRAAAGLGVVPTGLTETIGIYHTPPTVEEVKARLSTLYRPYHTALSELIQAGLTRFGQVLLVDCHSMPGFAPMGSRRPDIILGDRFGSSCHPDTLAHIKTLFMRAGYSVGVNYPYAGGYTTEFYGRPDDGVEAIQIEINRDLYVNPVTLSKKTGYARLAADLEKIIHRIIDRQVPQNLAAQ